MRRTASSLIIHTDSEFSVFEDCNPDAPPTVLSGTVILDLSGALPFDSVDIVFYGTADIPSHNCESADTLMSHTICAHESNLFRCDIGGCRYFCPGRHIFPFTFRLGASLPASTLTSTSRTASVRYELRASATCQSVHKGLYKAMSIPLIRTLPADSLAFQQSLEVQSSQAGPVDFTIAFPHNTWAAGETLTCSLRALAREKGVTLPCIEMSVIETHRILGFDEKREQSRVVSRTNHVLHAKSSHSKRGLSSTLPQRFRVISPTARTPAHTSHPQTGEETVAVLSLSLPESTQASQSIPPVSITHRIECVLSVVDSAGCLSEISCSLPLRVLDTRLRAHVSAATMLTRRVFFGFCGHLLDEGDWLPSYPAHIRDRAPLFSSLETSSPSSDTPTYDTSTKHFTSGLPPLDVMRTLPRYRN